MARMDKPGFIQIETPNTALQGTRRKRRAPELRRYASLGVVVDVS